MYLYHEGISLLRDTTEVRVKDGHSDDVRVFQDSERVTKCSGPN